MQYKVTTPTRLEADRMAQIDLRAIEEAIAMGLVRAAKLGYVVEVTLDPEPPLAQGHYTPNIRIRERKDLGMLREAERKAAGQWSAIYDASDVALAAGRSTILPEDFK